MNTKMGAIYCLENILDNKKYIGYAKNVVTRWANHRWNLRHNQHRNNYLQHVYNKYGENIFKFWVIQEFEYEWERAKLLEIYWISFYNSFIDDGEGYNLTRGGDGFLDMSEDTRDFMSKNRMGKKIVKDSSSKYVGVYFNNTKQRWSAVIWDGTKQAKLGTYFTEAEAALAYNNKAKELYGENARINSISQQELDDAFEISRKIKEEIKNNKSSKYNDVIWSKFANKWSGRIQLDNQTYFLGYFYTEIDAALAVNKKILELNTDKIKMNIISEEEINQNIIEKGKIQNTKTSKYRGVYWSKSHNIWSSRIGIDYKSYYIGDFKYEIEAALAYNEIALEIWGYKAKLNQISQSDIEWLWNQE